MLIHFCSGKLRWFLAKHWRMFDWSWAARLLLPCKRHRIIIQLRDNVYRQSPRAVGKALGIAWLLDVIEFVSKIRLIVSQYLFESLPTDIYWTEKPSIQIKPNGFYFCCWIPKNIYIFAFKMEKGGNSKKKRK